MDRKKFYQSKVWKNVRKTVWLNQCCLCSRCHRAVYVDGISDKSIPSENRLRGIVHHKEYLNDTNFLDDSIALNFDLLEGLCIDCHNNEHFKTECVRDDLTFDADGNLISR